MTNNPAKTVPHTRVQHAQLGMHVHIQIVVKKKCSELPGMLTKTQLNDSVFEVEYVICSMQDPVRAIVLPYTCARDANITVGYLLYQYKTWAVVKISNH